MCSIVRRLLAYQLTFKLTDSHAVRNKFNYIIGYSEDYFLPHHATSLSMKLCQKLFVECFSVLRALPDLLREEEGLGAHTGVVVLSASFGARYFWCHKSIRPWGVKVALQCPQCFAVRTLSFSAGGSSGTYIVRCRCGWHEECDVGLSNVFYPDGGNGWARQILYGTEADFQRVRNAPRDTYDTAL
jgi:hypothetical protein